MNRNEQDVKSFEIEDLTYRLAEMIDAMNSSIDNCKKVIGEQNRLIEILEANASEEFKDFIDSCKNAVKDLSSQHDTLVIRKELLSQVVAKCNEDKDIARYISILLVALGVFENK